MLPHASLDGLSGLLEIVQATRGHDDIADLASSLSLEVDDLLPLVDAALREGFFTDLLRRYYSADEARADTAVAREAVWETEGCVGYSSAGWMLARMSFIRL